MIESTVPHSWREESVADEDEARRRSFWSRLDGLTTGIGLILASIAALLSLLRPPPKAMLVTLVASPPGQLGSMGSQGESTAEAVGSIRFHRVLDSSAIELDRLPLGEQLRGLLVSSKPGPVVVYVSAQVRVHPRGWLAMVPTEADPLDPGQWIPLREVFLAALDRSDGRALVLLELAETPEGLGSGVLVDEVAGRISSELDAIGEKLAGRHLLVLASHSPGESAEAIGPGGWNAFRMAIARGLAGSADGAGPDRFENGVVEARELVASVVDQLDRRARRLGVLTPTPVLYGRGDFALVPVNRGRIELPDEDVEEQAGASYPEDLARSWERRERLRARGGSRRSPALVRLWESTLIEAERAWLEGRPEEVVSTLMDRADRLERETIRPGSRGSVSIASLRSLEEAEASGLLPGPKAKAALDAFRSADPPAGPGPPGPGGTQSASASNATSNAASASNATDPAPSPSKNRADAGQDRLKGLLGSIGSLPPLEATWLAVRAATEAADAGTIKAIDDQLFGRLGRFEAAEAVTLHRLAGAGVPAPSSRAALRLDASLHRIRSTPDAFPWLSPLVLDAASAMNDSEILLAVPGFGPSDPRYDRRISEATDAVREIDRALELLALRDEASAFLSAFGSYLALGPELPDAIDPRSGPPVRPARETWRQAVLDLGAIDRRIGPLMRDDPDEPASAVDLRRAIDATDRPASALREGIATLRTSIGEDRLQRLRSRSEEPDHSGLRWDVEALALLSTPLLDSKQRSTLAEALRGGPGATVSDPAGSPPTPRTSPGDDQRRATLAASISVDLLALCEADPGTLQSLCGRIEQAGGAPAEVSALRHRVDRLSPTGRPSGGNSSGVDAGNSPGIAGNGSEHPPEDEVAFLASLGLDLASTWARLARTTGRNGSPFDANRLGMVLPDALLPGLALDLDGRGRLLEDQGRSALRSWNARVDLRQALRSVILGDEAASFFREAAMAARSASGVPVPGFVSARLSTIDPERNAEPGSAGASVPSGLLVEVSASGGSSGADGSRSLSLSIQLLSPVGMEPPLRLDAAGLPGSRPTEEGGLEIDVRPPSTVDVPMTPGSAMMGTTVLALATIDGWTYARPIGVGTPPSTASIDVLIGPPGGRMTVRDRVAIRPGGAKQPIAMAVRNLGSKPVDLRATVAIGLGDDARTIASAELKGIPPGGDQSIPIGAPPPPPASPTPPTPSPNGTSTDQADPGSPVEVSGPIVVRLADAGNPDAPEFVRQIALEVEDPAGYVGADGGLVTLTGPSSYRIDLSLRALKPLGDPPCPVRLELPSGRNPDLLTGRDGDGPPADDRPTLPEDRSPIALRVDGVRLDPGGSGLGELDVGLDGVPRAMLYRIAFPGDAQPSRLEPIDDLRLRLSAPEVAPAGPPLDVVVELDNAPEGSRLIVGLGRDPYRSGRPPEVRSGSRWRRITVEPKANALIFQAEAGDWTIEVPTAGENGPRVAWARLIGEGGEVLAEGFRRVVLDARPPQSLAFVGLDSPVEAGKPITVRAEGRDAETRVEAVSFFIGQAGEDGSVPEGVKAVPGARVESSPGSWEATLTPVGTGPSPISAVFTDSVGRSRAITRVVRIVAELPIQPSRIEGVVRFGEQPVPGIAVELFQADATDPLQTAPADASGRFRFENLKPGAYRVRVIRRASADRAEAAVDLKAGAVETLELSLTRLGSGSASRGASQPPR